MAFFGVPVGDLHAEWLEDWRKLVIKSVSLCRAPSKVGRLEEDFNLWPLEAAPRAAEQLALLLSEAHEDEVQTPVLSDGRAFRLELHPDLLFQNSAFVYLFCLSPNKPEDLRITARHRSKNVGYNEFEARFVGPSPRNSFVFGTPNVCQAMIYYKPEPPIPMESLGEQEVPHGSECCPEENVEISAVPFVALRQMLALCEDLQTQGRLDRTFATIHGNCCS